MRLLRIITSSVISSLVTATIYEAAVGKLLADWLIVRPLCSSAGKCCDFECTIDFSLARLSGPFIFHMAGAEESRYLTPVPLLITVVDEKLCADPITSGCNVCGTLLASRRRLLLACRLRGSFAGLTTSNRKGTLAVRSSIPEIDDSIRLLCSSGKFVDRFAEYEEGERALGLCSCEGPILDVQCSLLLGTSAKTAVSPTIGPLLSTRF